MNISDFANTRGIQSQAIYKYLDRHPELKKMTRKVGKTLELSPEAEAALDKVYPLPKPVEVIEDKAAREELIKTQKLVIQLQQQLSEQALLLARAEATQLLLDDKTQQLEEEKKRTLAADQRTEDYKTALQEAQAEIDRLKTRSLWDRILNK